ncbi:hypothetical protein DLJ49_00620 [Rhodovulum sp. 12E13]|uniref:hypothetical protein n=1 Tax=Rhodovulum sp. 12E13 TaxID=2203891 RepID=UPI000E1983B7|nr:hypothetical protein [Rhodovulum sp. 12E13]RDC75291.1 hypothetical protein DLJ49_00620 [Rhodovulum sp. 12E13]
MLKQKGIRAEVVEGVDLEEAMFLTGDRVSVGSGPDDTLRLGGARIVPGHVVFARAENGRGWEYFTSGAGEVEISSGNPRTGPARPGLTFRLGADTVLKLTREALPAQLRETGEEERKEIPLVIALPIMAAVAIGFGVYVNALTSGGSREATGLRTAPWLTDLAAYGRALDVCLEAAGAETTQRVPAGAPDAAFRAYSAAAAAGLEGDLPDLRLALGRQVRSLIVDAHLLAGAGHFSEAAETLRRVPPMLPTDNETCPINTAARADFSVFQRRAE